MTTARAVTDATGRAVISDELFNFGCKVDSFVIESSGRGSKLFPPESLMEPNGGGLLCIGDMLGSKVNDIDLIGWALYESGEHLASTAKIMSRRGRKDQEKIDLEVWYKGNRYRVCSGRVYGHRLTKARLSPRW